MNNFAYVIGIILVIWFFSFVYGQYKNAVKMKKREDKKYKIRKNNLENKKDE
jgi:hypothetical protein